MQRHAINYLNMTKSKAVKGGGIIDNEEAFIGVPPATLSCRYKCSIVDGWRRCT